MTRRVLSLLLIPLLLVSQGMCFGHSHRDDSVAESEAHNARPHFHVHGHRHHHHNEQHHDGAKHRHDAQHHRHPSETPAGDPPVSSHDDDAVYLAAMMTFSTICSVSAVWIGKHWLVATFTKIANCEVILAVRSGYLWNQPPPIDPTCPLYLRTQAFRC